MEEKERLYWCIKALDNLYNAQKITGAKRDEIVFNLKSKLLRIVYDEIEKGV